MSAGPPEIVHGLETPYPLRPCQNYFRLEGWVLLRGAAAATRARIRVGETIYEPDTRPHRADVAALYPEERFAADSGFSFVCFLPFGNHLAILEATPEGHDTWYPVRTMIVPVSSHPLMGAFEPAGVDGVIRETLRPSGWVWHPEFVIAEVRLLFGDMALAVEFGLERPDVAERFPHQPQARFAGFIAAENLPRGRGPLRLQILTQCGRTYFLDPHLEGRLETGSYAPPRPPREMWEMGASRRAPRIAASTAGGEAGPHNVLFVLYGDFTSNSAAHIAAFANELIARGYDCIVAVPEHAETIGALSQARFLAVEFSELDDLANYFRDGKGPAVIHSWTTRERVRIFCEDALRRFDADLMIHLEDNERELLANHLACPPEDLPRMSAESLDSKVPIDLTHPARADAFMALAAGVTVIIESLAEFVPAGTPFVELWPAAATTFTPRPPNPSLRRRLGIHDEDVILFYHGNAHRSNASEMLALYQAVLALNKSGLRTWLIRAGRDEPEFAALVPNAVRQHLIELGFVKHRRVPELMSVADMFVQPGVAGAFNNYRFPSKLPEFFAIGRPVILPRTNLGNVLQHAQDAFVLDAADAPSIMAAVTEIHRDQTLSARLSEGALRFSKRCFSWSSTTGKLELFYLQHTRLKRPDSARFNAARTITAALHSTR